MACLQFRQCGQFTGQSSGGCNDLQTLHFLFASIGFFFAPPGPLPPGVPVPEPGSRGVAAGVLGPLPLPGVLVPPIWLKLSWLAASPLS